VHGGVHWRVRFPPTVPRLRKEDARKVKKGLDKDRIALILMDIIDMLTDIQEGKVTTELGLKTAKGNLWKVTRDLVKESLVDAAV